MDSVKESLVKVKLAGEEVSWCFFYLKIFPQIFNYKNTNVMNYISKYMNKMCTVFLLVSWRYSVLG